MILFVFKEKLGKKAYKGMSDLKNYFYVLGIPVTVPNIIWIVITSLLVASYLCNYVINPGGLLGKALKYFIQYGKAKSSSGAYDLPKRYFTHYYVLATLWNSACLLSILGICYGFTSNNWMGDMFGLRGTTNVDGDQVSIILVMFMITIHSMKRLYECLAVSVFSSKAKINIIQYIWGFVYYLLLAPTLISESLPFGELPFGSMRARHVIGMVVFGAASYIHHRTHVIFADMRKKGKVKQDSHGIPQGGMFSSVSCPHYFAEVLIYVATLIIVSPQCRSWWLVLAYNVIAHANMGMSAHLWYKQTFPSYPVERKAYIPFVF